MLFQYQLAKVSGVECHDLPNVPTNKLLIADVNQIDSAMKNRFKKPKSV
jgi:hypothetical protein